MTESTWSYQGLHFAQSTLHNNPGQDATLERIDPVIGVPASRWSEHSWRDQIARCSQALTSSPDTGPKTSDCSPSPEETFDLSTCEIEWPE